MSKPKRTKRISKSAVRRVKARASLSWFALVCCAFFGAVAPVQAADGYILDEAFRRSEPIADSQYSCYRYGRCEADNLRYERLRAQRLERLAPQAPAGAPLPAETRRDVRPTAAEEIQPAYQNAGGIREEFLNSGSRK